MHRSLLLLLGSWDALPRRLSIFYSLRAQAHNLRRARVLADIIGLTDKEHVMVDHKEIYEELKETANEAYRLYQRTGLDTDFLDFMDKEDICSDYAYKHESEIWNDC